MEERFNQIKNIRFEIKDTFAKLTAKKDTVRGYYIQYIEKNKKNKMFGLDSFHFQSKLIELEYKHLNEHYIFIDNRIYCDYYKLYNILIAFYKQHFKTDFKHRNYPIYKDLEPFKQYDFDDINNVHYDIIEMIQHAYAIISQTNEEIKMDQQKLRSGFNIDNYVHNTIYKNTILMTNINLYENYLNSYHIYHMDFLRNLRDKLSLFKTQLSTNVRTDGSATSSSTRSENSIDRSADDEIHINIDRSMSQSIPRTITRSISTTESTSMPRCNTPERNCISPDRSIISPDRSIIEDNKNDNITQDTINDAVNIVTQESIDLNISSRFTSLDRYPDNPSLQKEPMESLCENLTVYLKESLVENISNSPCGEPPELYRTERINNVPNDIILENIVECEELDIEESKSETSLEEVITHPVETPNESILESDESMDKIIFPSEITNIIQSNHRGIDPNIIEETKNEEINPEQNKTEETKNEKEKKKRKKKR
jgi:hypothetical protein